MQGRKSFVDCCILSQREKSKDPLYYLEKIEQIFTHMMPMEKRIFKDGAGRDHVRLECKDSHDFAVFVETWSSLLKQILGKIPKHSQKKMDPTHATKHLKKELFLVMKIQTDLTNLSNYLMNLANSIYPLMGLKVFYEDIADGVITYIQDDSDFKTLLTPISNEKVVREYYQKLGITSEDFLAQREKILKNVVP